jgi:hypothetical protein
MSKFLERCSKINCLKAEIKPLNLSLYPFRENWHIQYLNEAAECFHKDLPISCIVVSSALVERTLFWHKIQIPSKAPKTLSEGRLAKLFKEFIDWDILLNSLLDEDERLNLTFVREKQAQEREISWKTIREFRYIQIRNIFAHGSELLFPWSSLSHLIPPTTWALSDYGIDSKEWINPPLITIAYTHLLKTLRFIKAFTNSLSEKEKSFFASQEKSN